jgi:hypothetical protein
LDVLSPIQNLKGDPEAIILEYLEKGYIIQKNEEDHSCQALDDDDILDDGIQEGPIASKNL